MEEEEKRKGKGKEKEVVGGKESTSTEDGEMEGVEAEGAETREVRELLQGAGPSASL